MVEIHLSAKELTRIGQWYELMYASEKYEVTSSDIKRHQVTSSAEEGWSQLLTRDLETDA